MKNECEKINEENEFNKPNVAVLLSYVQSKLC